MMTILETNHDFICDLHGRDGLSELHEKGYFY